MTTKWTTSEVDTMMPYCPLNYDKNQGLTIQYFGLKANDENIRDFLIFFCGIQWICQEIL